MSYKPKLILALTACLLISQSMATTIYNANSVTFSLDSYVGDVLTYSVQTPSDAHSMSSWFAIVWYGNSDGTEISGPGTYNALLFERVPGTPFSGVHSTGQMIVGDGPSFNVTGLASPGISYNVAGDTTSSVQVDVSVSGLPSLSTFSNWGCMVHSTDQVSYGYASNGSRDEIQTFMINGESYCASTGETTLCVCGTGFDENCVGTAAETSTDGTSGGTDIGGMRSGALRLAMAGVTTAALANNFF